MTRIACIYLLCFTRVKTGTYFAAAVLIVLGALIVYEHTDRFEDALVVCQQALQENPGNFSLMFTAAKLASKIGKNDKAHGYWQQYASR
jgi:hypothetical protein